MPASRTANFRFQGTRALLTYSRVGTFDVAYDFAVAVIPAVIVPHANANLVWRWAVEQHHDEGIEEGDHDNGSFHVHVAFDLGRAATERGHIFDFRGNHPNIKTCGGKTQWKNTLAYLTKDLCFQDNIGNDGQEAEEARGAGEDTWGDIVAAETLEEATELLKTTQPKALVCNYNNVKAYLRDTFPPPPPPTIPTRDPNDFTFSDEQRAIIRPWLNTVLIPDLDLSVRHPTLVLIGPGGTGKTEFARSLEKNFAHMSGGWDAEILRKGCEDRADLLILDDIPLESQGYYRYKPLFGNQVQFQNTGKYKSETTLIRTWKGVIWCTNEDPRETPGWSSSYINSMCTFVNIPNKLF